MLIIREHTVTQLSPPIRSSVSVMFMNNLFIMFFFKFLILSDALPNLAHSVSALSIVSQSHDITAWQACFSSFCHSVKCNLSAFLSSAFPVIYLPICKTNWHPLKPLLLEIETFIILIRCAQ